MCLLLVELFSPRPIIFRDVIQVDLVPQISQPNTQVSAPPPKPPPKPPPEAENPLWSKLGQPPSATPSDAADSLVDDWNRLDTRPDPTPVTRSRENLSEWWQGETKDAPPPEAAADVAPAEESRLSDLWEQINAELPNEAQSDQSEWWKAQEDAVLAPTKARQAHATAQGGTPRYLAVVERRVAARWSPPDIFRNRGAVQVTLSFRLSKDGRVREAKVVRSSGSMHYDQAAVRAVLTADPFPAFPDEISEPYLNIRFTFTLDRDGLG